MLLLKADTEGPALIFYAASQHGFHFTCYSFRASAAHMLSTYLPGETVSLTSQGASGHSRGRAVSVPGNSPFFFFTLSLKRYLVSIHYSSVESTTVSGYLKAKQKVSSKFVARVSREFFFAHSSPELLSIECTHRHRGAHRAGQPICHSK
jgi:hypothetical protein